MIRCGDPVGIAIIICEGDGYTYCDKRKDEEELSKPSLYCRTEPVTVDHNHTTPECKKWYLSH